MQDVNSLLIMKSYNGISFVVIGLIILIRWPVTGEPPLASMMIWTWQSALMLAVSTLAHLVAQLTTFYVN